MKDLLGIRYRRLLVIGVLLCMMIFAVNSVSAAGTSSADQFAARYKIVNSVIAKDPSDGVAQVIYPTDMADYLNMAMGGVAKSGGTYNNYVGSVIMTYYSPVIKNANQMKVIIKSKAMAALAESATKKYVCRFGVSGGIGSVEILSPKGISQLAANEGDVAITITKVVNKNSDYPSINVEITKSDKRVDNVSGGILVSIPYNMPNRDDSNSLVVYDVAENGIGSMMPGAGYMRNLKFFNGSTGGMVFSCDGSGKFDVAYNKCYFNDVPGWSVPYVNYVVSHNIMAGTAVNKFSPNDKVTRGQLAQILANMSDVDLSNVTGKDFSDVVSSESVTSYNAIKWASGVGLITGYNDGTFRPNAYVTRAEFSAMLYRYCNVVANSYLNKAVNAISFKDKANIPNFAVLPVSYLQQAGVISGDARGHFNPTSNVTKVECAKMVSCLQAGILNGSQSFLPII